MMQSKYVFKYCCTYVLDTTDKLCLGEIYPPNPLPRRENAHASDTVVGRKA